MPGVTHVPDGFVTSDNRLIFAADGVHLADSCCIWYVVCVQQYGVYCDTYFMYGQCQSINGFQDCGGFGNKYDWCSYILPGDDCEPASNYLAQNQLWDKTAYDTFIATHAFGTVYTTPDARPELNDYTKYTLQGGPMAHCDAVTLQGTASCT